MTDKKVRIPGAVRDELRAYADDHDLTYTEALLDILPEDEERRIDRGESFAIGIETRAYERLDALTGEGVDYGDVVAHFLAEATNQETIRK